MVISAIAAEEMSAEETGTAYLTLLTISHPDLGTPIRFTSDNVNTVSNSNTFVPFPYNITLPDDTEGQIPEAQLVIDNTSTEIIAILRQLTSPPIITLQVVRSADTDYIERQWTGLEWRSTSHNPDTITGKLTVENLTTEEFPPLTFDESWDGLYPG